MTLRDSGEVAIIDGDSKKIVKDAAGTGLRLLNGLFEDHCLVELTVPGAIQERDASTCGTLSQRIQLGCVLAEFGAVAPTKFGPTFRVVAKPLSQLGARCKLA